VSPKISRPFSRSRASSQLQEKRPVNSHARCVRRHCPNKTRTGELTMSNTESSSPSSRSRSAGPAQLCARLQASGQFRVRALTATPARHPKAS